jgi:hypothetical protein
MNSYNKEIGKKGFLSYKCNNKYIYSIYDPIAEAKRFVDSFQQLNKVVITCCGADFVNKTLLEHDIDEIISFEPILFDAVEHSKKIVRFSNLRDLENYLFSRKYSNISLLIWQPLVESNPDIYLDNLKKIKDIIQKLIFSNNTEIRFGFLETRNFLRNIFKFDNINILEASAVKIENPAIIISSGFSLEDNIDFINQVKEYCYLFSLPSSLPFLQSKNITPDFSIAVDPGFATYYHISKFKNKLNFICPLTITPSILNLPNITPYFFSYQTFLENKLFNNSNIISSSAEGSVFINLLRLLPQLGFQKVILIGQDFGFKNNRSHINGGFFEIEFINQSNYLNPIENEIKKLDVAKNIDYIPNNNNKIKTDTALKIYYNHFLENNFNINIYISPYAFNKLENKFNILTEDFIKSNFIKKGNLNFHNNFCSLKDIKHNIKNIFHNNELLKSDFYFDNNNKIHLKQIKKYSEKYFAK